MDIEFVGGPHDGRTADKMPDDMERYRFPVTQMPTFVHENDPTKIEQFPVSEYEVAWYIGGRSMTDEGRIRFVYKGDINVF